MIRNAIPEDSSRIAEISVMGWRYGFKEFIDEHILFCDISVHKRNEKIRGIIQEKPESIFVYEENRVLKGFISIGKCENSDKANALAIWDIFVEPAFTSQGIGTSLLEYVEKQALIKQYDECVVWVFENNKRAKKLYERLGYIKDGVIEENEVLKLRSERYCKFVR